MKNILFIGNGFDIEHGIKIEFEDFVTWARKRKLFKSYQKYFEDDNYINLMNSTNLWADFENFLKKIIDQNNKLRHIYFLSLISKIFEDWFKAIIQEKYFIPTFPSKSARLSSLLKHYQIYCIITFNYSETPEIYDFKQKTFFSNTIPSEYHCISKWEKKYLKIHDYKTKIGNCILGHDQSKKINKNNFITKWNDNNNFNPKKEILKTIINSKEIEKLVFYGFSFGDSDSEIIDFLAKYLKKSIERKIIIFYLEEELEKIKSKFKKFLGRRRIEWKLIS